MGHNQCVEADLEPALSFLRELWALDQALASTSKQMLGRMGITAEQRMVMRFIGKHPGTSARDLAAMLYVQKSTLSLALKRLEAKKLVVRRRDPSDSRRTFIDLTPAGKRFARPEAGTVERAVERTLAATDPRDIGRIRQFVRLLVTMLEEESRNDRAGRATGRKRRST